MNERVKSPTFDFPFDPHRNHSPKNNLLNSSSSQRSEGNSKLDPDSEEETRK